MSRLCEWSNGSSKRCPIVVESTVNMINCFEKCFFGRTIDSINPIDYSIFFIVCFEFFIKENNTNNYASKTESD